MGSITSKVTRPAPTLGLRKYPKRDPTHIPPPTTNKPLQPPSSPSPSPLSSSSNQQQQQQQNEPPPPPPTPTPNQDPPSSTLLTSLRTLGPVTPINLNLPPFPSSSSSPLILLAARTRIRAAAEAEFARSRLPTGFSPSLPSQGVVGEGVGKERAGIGEEEGGIVGAGGNEGEGRRFLDVATIRKVLVLRDERGLGEGEIERVMGLGGGVVRGLGGRGVVGVC